MKVVSGLTKEEKEMLVAVLEASNPKAITTMKDIRAIDRICTTIETSGDGDVNFEDADHSYFVSRIQDFPSWNARGRKELLALADKLGI